jgi:hypothetical protein
MSTFPTIEDILKWPAPNYVDPVTRRPLVLAVEIPLTVLTILFTAGRFYSRTVLVKALGWDDWFMLAATVRKTRFAYREYQRLTMPVVDSINSYKYHDMHIDTSRISDWISSLRSTTRDLVQPLQVSSSKWLFL